MWRGEAGRCGAGAEVDKKGIQRPGRGSGVEKKTWGVICRDMRDSSCWTGWGDWGSDWNIEGRADENGKLIAKRWDKRTEWDQKLQEEQENAFASAKGSGVGTVEGLGAVYNSRISIV